MGMLFLILYPYSSLCQDVNRMTISKIVIDPGHGGEDPGCLSPNKKLKEKDICLSVSLILGKLIKQKYPRIQVIYTRSTDVKIPLDRRASIANKNHADLFISIHVNAETSHRSSGSETFIMGSHKTAENLAVCMLENSVIGYEENYAARYNGYRPDDPGSFIIFNLMQNAYREQSLQLASYVQQYLSQGPIGRNRGVKQGGLLVLWKCSMPAVLVELGFITHAEDRKVLASSAGRQKMARQLLLAFEAYKESYEKTQKTIRGIKIADSIAAPASPKIDTDGLSDKTAPRDKAERASFRVQIFATTRPVRENAPDFKNYKGAQFVKAGKYYKYTLGDFPTLEAAKEYRKKIRKSFPQAFVICVQGSRVIPYY